MLLELGICVHSSADYKYYQMSVLKDIRQKLRLQIFKKFRLSLSY